MKRVYLSRLPRIQPPPRGLNGWVLRSRREVIYISSEGFLQEDDKGLHRLVLLDKPAQEICVAGEPAKADSSSWSQGERVWRLPPRHVRLIFDTHVYAPRPMGPVRLAVRMCNGQPAEAYLEVDAGVSHSTLDDDAHTLLSGLKSCGRYTPCLQQQPAPS